MKSIAFLLIACCLPAFAMGQELPNIVLIFIDDMGWKDAGYQGSDLYETPSIDRLAKEGMQFTNAYAAAGNCAPSRACMLSGQYTPRHHVYAVWSTERGPKKLMKAVPVPNREELKTEAFTFGEAMQQCGYRTGMFGKWHLGKQGPFMPRQQGFDVVDSMNPPGNKKFKETNDPKWVDRITSSACQFIRDSHQQKQPFLAYISHHATHMGIQAREKTYQHFADKGPGELHANTRYAAMNSEMDRGVGEVLDLLDELKLNENTLVIFTSDNGALPQSPPKPLRGYKGMYYEGGIRVPMIARWLGKIESGTICNVPVINIDFYPTFLSLAQGNLRSDYELDGADITPLLFQHSEQWSSRSIFWHFPGYLDGPNPGSRDSIFRSRPVTTIRQGDWKLLLHHEEWFLQEGASKYEGVELFNVTNDIGETTNLASAEIKKRNALIAEIQKWWKQKGALNADQANPNFKWKSQEK